jgi:hypothetical protein
MSKRTKKGADFCVYAPGNFEKKILLYRLLLFELDENYKFWNAIFEICQFLITKMVDAPIYRLTFQLNQKLKKNFFADFVVLKQTNFHCLKVSESDSSIII